MQLLHAHLLLNSPYTLQGTNSKAVAAKERKEEKKDKEDSKKSKQASAHLPHHSTRQRLNNVVATWRLTRTYMQAEDESWAAAGEGAKSKAQAKKDEQVL